MSKEKPSASISLDLDDLWTYLKTHGDASWTSYPSYLSYAVPRILDFLDQLKQKITFFIVGQDATFASNKDLLGEIAHRGHEIANHSFKHDPWLNTYAEEDVYREISEAEEKIEKVTNVKPVGFRAPGFSHSENVILALIRKGYLYDASTFPNLLNPLARLYFLRTSKLSSAERKKRAGLFGTWKDGLRSNRPHLRHRGGEYILEMPVTTMPTFRIPMHASYLLYLSTYSDRAASAYLTWAIQLCRLHAIAPSFLLHPLDFIGCDDTDRLSFFPGMNMPSQQKMERMKSILTKLQAHFDLIPMKAMADTLNTPATWRGLKIVST